MTDARPLISPYCVHLKSKRTYFLDGPPRVESDILDGAQHCWCTHTMQAVGPDGKIVDPRDCATHKTRSCFEPYGPR